MHESFEYILKQFGEPKSCSQFSSEEYLSIQKLLPNSLHEFFQNYGRCTLRSGRMQICHPDDLAPVLEIAFENDTIFNESNSHAFSYSAFGKIYFFHDTFGGGSINLLSGQVFCKNLTNPPPPGTSLENSVLFPFVTNDSSLDCFDENGSLLFKKTLRKLGKLSPGDCYGFVPSIGLGGTPRLESIKILKAKEHFSIISQLADYRLITVDEKLKIITVRNIG